MSHPGVLQKSSIIRMNILKITYAYFLLRNTTVENSTKYGDSSANCSYGVYQTGEV